MSEHKEHNSHAPAPGGDVLALLQRMQQQLVYLERKIDTLLAAGGAVKPHFTPRPYQDRGNRAPSEHRPGGEGRPFTGHRGQGHGYKKKPFYGRPKG